MNHAEKKNRRARPVSVGKERRQALQGKGANDMATSQLNGLVRHLRRAALLPGGGGMTDGQLLECFLSRRDEAAFEALVHRHGPMVLGLCRRVLHNDHDVEDAFQATFLVLVRKAASIGQQELVGNWLYGVARRAALEVNAARRRAREKQVRVLPEVEAVAETDGGRDLRSALDQELSRLPDKYRVPVVLCDLEGWTRRGAAQQLGVPTGTLSGRLTTARRLLARRLARRGFALSGGALAVVLAQGAATACVPPLLAASTARAATRLAAGQATAAGLIAVQGGALVGIGVQSMVLSKLNFAAVVLLVAGLFGGAVALLAQPALATRQTEARPPRVSTSAAKAAEKPQVAVTWQERLAIPSPGDQETSGGVAVSPDGKTLAIGYAHGAKIVDVATGRERVTLPGRACAAIAFSPDGKVVAQGHLLEGHPITLADSTSGETLAELTGAAKNCCSLAFSPNGKVLATAADTVRLWDLATKKELRRFTSNGPREYGVYAIAFSPDGQKLASAEGSDKTVIVWEVATGKQLVTFKGHAEYAVAVALSSDGKTVASGGGEGAIRVWDLDTGKERAALKATTVQSLAFSPDGKMLASAGHGDDKTVKLWDVSTAKEIANLTAHTRLLRGLAFSRDGNFLVTAGEDAVRIWVAEK
jgi:RNA polymerase sigma factor (sigma-70 family)